MNGIPGIQSGPEPESSRNHDTKLTLQPYPNAYAALPINTKGAVCPHTGLRHAHLSKLLKPGGQASAHVRVVVLREPGARHGKTLFHVGDFLRWLDYLASSQAAQRQEPPPDLSSSDSA